MKRIIKNTALVVITAFAIAYMIIFISMLPFIGAGSAVVGGMAWCIAGIWVALFILANYPEEEKR